MGGSGANQLRSWEKSWSLAARKLTVSFQSGNDLRDGAFYEIRNDGKVWRVPEPVYHPKRAGVDGLNMEDYAEQKVYISPDGDHIAIVEDAGGEDVANLLLARNADNWKAALVTPKVELFKAGKVLPFSVITGVTNTDVLFGGYPVAFSELRVYKEQEVTPLAR